MPERLNILKKRTVQLNIAHLASFFLVIIIVITLFVYNNAKQILLHEDGNVS